MLATLFKMLWVVLVAREGTQEFYDSFAERYDVLVGGQPDSEDARDFLAEYARHHGVRLEAVLDVGCGTGLYSERLQAVCNRLHGTDFSKGQLHEARRKGSEMTLVGADAVTLPYRDECFDVVTSFELLAHLPGREREYFDEAYRVLKPGGIFFPDPNTPFRRSDSLADGISWAAGRATRRAIVKLSNIEAWSRIPTRSELTAAMEDAGFETEVCERTYRKTWPFLIGRKPA